MRLASAAAPVDWEDVEAGAVCLESPATQVGSPFAEEADADADSATVAGDAQESYAGSGDELRLEEEKHRVQLKAAVTAAVHRLEDLEEIVIARGHWVPEDQLLKEFEVAWKGAYGSFDKVAAGMPGGRELAAARGRVTARIVEVWTGIQGINSRLARHQLTAHYLKPSRFLHGIIFIFLGILYVVGALSKPALEGVSDYVLTTTGVLTLLLGISMSVRVYANRHTDPTTPEAERRQRAVENRHFVSTYLY